MEPKWRIIIGRKKRGFWRPPITIQIWIEGGSGNPLNVHPDYQFPIVKDKQFEDFLLRCKNYGCSSCKNIPNAVESPFSFYRDELHRKNSFYFKSCGCGNTRMLLYGRLPSIEDIFNREYSATLYPEWRPGIPDYADVYEWLRDNLVLPCINEFNRRIQEAMESPETGEIIYDSDSFKIHEPFEETKRVSRKLKVI